MGLSRKLPPPKKSTEKKSLLVRKPNLDADLGIELPTEASAPSDHLGDYTILIHGSKKIGKTSLASKFPNAFGCMFEPGAEGLYMKHLGCPTWQHYKQIQDKLDADPTYCDTLIIDTGSLAYDRCMEYACAKAGIEHPGDEGFGKGWDRVKKELVREMNRAMLRKCGTIVLCHTKLEEVETITGRTYNKLVPDLSGQAQGYFSAAIDIIGYYHLIDNKRWLQIREDDYAVAGCRPETHFLTQKGEQVFKIPMGNNSQEAYDNFVKAFENRQEESYAPEGVKRFMHKPKIGGAVKRPALVAKKKFVAKKR